VSCWYSTFFLSAVVVFSLNGFCKPSRGAGKMVLLEWANFSSKRGMGMGMGMRRSCRVLVIRTVRRGIGGCYSLVVDLYIFSSDGKSLIEGPGDL
jgi:hypothetical protein